MMLFLLLVGLSSAVPLNEQCGYESCTQAKPGVLNVHIVPHTHDDVGWLKTVDQYYYGSKNNIQKAGVQYILDSVIKELWQDSKRRFVYVETAFLWKWWVRQGAGVRGRVRALVGAGRLQFAGGAWSMNDEAAAHYQSTIDQFTWGLKKLNDTFGPCAVPRVGWQIDPFGHSREFASLLTQMGYDGLFLGRIDYQDKRARLRDRRMEMLWRGDDDLGNSSDIFTGVLFNTYSPPAGFCFDVLCSDEPIVDDTYSPLNNVDERVEQFLEVCNNMSRGYKTNNILVTMGEDFQYQDAAMWFINLDKLIQLVELFQLPIDIDQHINTHVACEAKCKLTELASTISAFILKIYEMSASYITNNILVTMGDDFQYQDANMWFNNLDKLIKYTNLKAAKDGLNIHLFYSTPDCYLKAVKDANPTLPTKQDDFFPYASDPTAYWTGYYTSRPTTKYFEREGNRYLQMVKNLQVLGGLEEHNIFILDELKSAMGVMQHHDAITGTEKQHVSRDYERLLDRAVQDGAGVARQGLSKLSTAGAELFSYDRCRLNESSCATSENSRQFVVTVYNPLGWNILEPIRIPVLDGTYEVYAPNGEKITSQLVNIPQPVINIPTRKSKATHEIVFIAKLHPLSIKSFYIKKITQVKRETNDYYSNTDYWRNIDNPYIVIENNDEKNIGIKDKIPIPLTHNNEAIDFDRNINIDVLKDKNSPNTGVEELENILKNGKAKIARKLDKMRYPSLSEEEYRLLADEPTVVQRSDEAYLENEFLKLRLDDSGVTHMILPDKTTNLKLQFLYWTGCSGDNTNTTQRSSGAYIFRPETTEPFALYYHNNKLVNGQVVQEFRAETENAATIGRVYEGLPFVEHDFIVGPIAIDDNIGKEYVIRYDTNVVNDGVFYTDSNGRQVLKRKLNERPQWNLTLEEPVAGNYYPVTNKIFIEDNKTRFTVLVDRSEGGTSLKQGGLELMVHRRLLHDDAFGVGEALNETAAGKGLVVRGKHRLLYLNIDDTKDMILEKKHTYQLHLEPLVFVSNSEHVTYERWLKLNNCFKGMKELPDGVHLLTLEPWDDKILLRLENYYELSQDSTVEVDLSVIFNTIKIKTIRETTLAANRWLDDHKKWSWRTENNFDKSFDDSKFTSVPNNEDIARDEGLKVKLKAKQIRTFVAEYELTG